MASAMLKRTSSTAWSSANFELVNPAARYWLDTVANVRVHGQTHKPPEELFAQEKLQPLHPEPYETAARGDRTGQQPVPH